MKTIYLYVLLTIISTINTKAQVGVNYTPFKDQVVNSPLIIKKQAGNALRFIPNSTGSKPGQVLISDNLGNVRYGDLNATKIEFINGDFNIGLKTKTGLNLDDVYANRSTVKYTNASITLPPGKWAVNFSLKFEILKDKLEQVVLVEYDTYTTRNRITANTFYNDRFTVVQRTQSLRYNPATDIDIIEDRCTGNGSNRQCFYTFRRERTSIQNQYNDNWGPLDRDESVWARVILSDRSTVASNDYNRERTADRTIDNLYLASGALTGVTQYTTVKGEIYITNKSGANKTYSLKLYLQTVNVKSSASAKYKLVDFAAGPTTNGIDRFFAIPAND